MQLLKNIGTYSSEHLPGMQGKGPRIWLAELKNIATRITNEHVNAPVSLMLRNSMIFMRPQSHCHLLEGVTQLYNECLDFKGFET